MGGEKGLSKCHEVFPCITSIILFHTCFSQYNCGYLDLSHFLSGLLNEITGINNVASTKSGNSALLNIGTDNMNLI